MVFVVTADSGCGDAAVILRPGVGNLTPVVAKGGDNLLRHKDLAADGAVASLGQASLLTGRVNRFIGHKYVFNTCIQNLNINAAGFIAL